MENAQSASAEFTPDQIAALVGVEQAIRKALSALNTLELENVIVVGNFGVVPRSIALMLASGQLQLVNEEVAPSTETLQ